MNDFHVVDARFPLSEKHAALHRSTPTAPLNDRPGRGLRRVALFVGVAVAATGIAVSAGVVTKDTPVGGAAAALSASTPTGASGLTEADLAEREQRASRSTDDRRPQADRTKVRTLSNASGVAVTGSEDLSTADPRALARALMPEFGMSSSEFDCVDNLWASESEWDVHADNPTSSAYGIPQSLPGSKMASAGPGWEDNAETQIRWGLGYIEDRYGSACAAWDYKQGAGWY